MQYKYDKTQLVQVLWILKDFGALLPHTLDKYPISITWLTTTTTLFEWQKDRCVSLNT